MFDILIEKINRFDSIVIFPHRNPDGDCYGAAVALKEVILTNFKNKNVYISSSGLEEFFDVLTPTDIVSDEIIKNSLGIIVDCSLFNRVEDQRVTTCLDLLAIDHHVDDSEKGLLTIKDKNINSSCELLVDIFKELDFVINVKCATSLCLGIVTDSGFCHFSKDFSKTFSSLAYLVDLGAKITDIIDVLSIQDTNTLDFKAYLYSSYNTLPCGVIYIVLDQKALKSFHMSASEALTYVNSIANVTNYSVWIAFIENSDGSMQVEFRGKNVDVHYLATLFGGGGHISASGCRINKFSKEKINEVLYSCENYLLDLSGDK
ncbi:MAG: bifunctional oligoribonuclease/PAP phosphatase NrnA [Bacilli bacterium]